MAFIHIPLPEYLQMRNDFVTYGNQRDHVGCSSVNSGFFAALKQAGTVQWVTCGHDHSNDFEGEYDGIKLSYGRKSGYGSYGPKYLQRGARVFELNESPFLIDSWIREEDLNVVRYSEPVSPSPWWWITSPRCSYAEEKNSQILAGAKDKEQHEQWKQRFESL